MYTWFTKFSAGVHCTIVDLYSGCTIAMTSSITTVCGLRGSYGAKVKVILSIIISYVYFETSKLGLNIGSAFQLKPL